VTDDSSAALLPSVRVLLTVRDAHARGVVAAPLGAKASVRLDVAEGDDAVLAAGTHDYDVIILDHGSVDVAGSLIDALIARAVVRRQATDYRIASEAQRLAQQRFSVIFGASPAPMFMAEVDSGIIVNVNAAFAELTGYPVDALRGRPLTDIDMWADEHRWRLLSRLTGGHVIRNVDMRLRHRAGGTRDILLATERISDGDRELCIGIATDVTELRVLERKVQQAQKMEALGQLAGGVAHDFNNLLMIIGGFAELIAERGDLQPDVARDVEEISKATRTAATLTRQLLAFGRRSAIEPKVLNINTVLEQMAAMLGRLLGEHVILRTKLATDLSMVRVDPGQIEQILMNLAVNARDAMPSGGQLTVETGDVVLDAGWATRHPGARSGRFAMLAVSDTGIGMDEQVRRQLFEPFFTTKDRGRGTGLGLAMVYGAVKQNGGSIWVYSEPGLGTTFKIYLPVVDSPADVPTSEASVARSPRGVETVLVVEDRDDVRNFVREVLSRHGYTVIEASTPRETLALLPTVGARVQLLVVDVVMPQMGGRGLARLCHGLYPHLRVLYMSGYPPEAIVGHGVLEPGLAFVQKPLETRVFLEKVRSVLDDPTPPPV
jgi:two-component system cell cycle sensor histidine kinase/response regulator CckA